MPETIKEKLADLEKRVQDQQEQIDHLMEFKNEAFKVKFSANRREILGEMCGRHGEDS